MTRLKIHLSYLKLQFLAKSRHRSFSFFFDPPLSASKKDWRFNSPEIRQIPAVFSRANDTGQIYSARTATRFRIKVLPPWPAGLSPR